MKNVALRVKSRKFVNGSHKVASVRGQEGLSLGVEIVLLWWPCVGVGIHLVLNQFCCKIMIVQCREGMLFHFILGREVKSVVLRGKSHNLVNGSHKIVSVQGREGVSSVVGIVSLLWPRVGFRSHRVANQLRVGGGVLCCCCRTCSVSARVKSLISCRLVPGGMWSGKEACAGASGSVYCRCRFLVVRVRLLSVSSSNWRRMALISSAVRQIVAKRVESSSIVNGSHEMVSPSNKKIGIRTSRCRVIWSQRVAIAYNLWWMGGGGCVGG